MTDRKEAAWPVRSTSAALEAALRRAKRA